MLSKTHVKRKENAENVKKYGRDEFGFRLNTTLVLRFLLGKRLEMKSNVTLLLLDIEENINLISWNFYWLLRDTVTEYYLKEVNNNANNAL